MQLFSLKCFGNHLKSQASPSLHRISNDQRDSPGDENFCSVWIFWLIFCTDAKNCDSLLLPLFSASWQFHNKIWNILHGHGIIWNIKFNTYLYLCKYTMIKVLDTWYYQNAVFDFGLCCIKIELHVMSRWFLWTYYCCQGRF